MNNNWVPVSDRLPEETGAYLCYLVHRKHHEYSMFEVCSYYNNRGENYFADENEGDYVVVAWMNLPSEYLYTDAEVDNGYRTQYIGL